MKLSAIIPMVLLASLQFMPDNALCDKSKKYTDKATVSELLQMADDVFNSRSYDSSRDIYMKAAAKAEEQNDSSGMAEAFAMIARTYLLADSFDVGRTYLKRSVETANPERPLGWSRYLGVRGRFEWKMNDLKRATATFKEMYDFCSQHQLYDRAVDAAHMVAIVGTPEEQVEWGLKGIKEAEAGNIETWLGPLWNNLGATYEEMGEYTKSLEAYLHARDYHYKYGDERNKAIADWCVAHAYRLNMNIEEPEKMLPGILDKFENLNDTEFLGWTWMELAEIEIIKENYMMASRDIYQAREFLQQAGMEEWDPQGYLDINKKLEETKKKTDRNK